MLQHKISRLIFPVIKVKVTQKINDSLIILNVFRKDIYLIATHFIISISFIQFNSDQEKKQRRMCDKLSIDILREKIYKSYKSFDSKFQ